MSQSITVTVHAATGLPEKLGSLHKTAPYVQLHMMKDKFTTATVKSSSSEASWEETATFQWDGTSHLAIDLMSKDTCFAKGWIDLNPLVNATGQWKGVFDLTPHGNSTAQCKLLCTIVNHSFVQPPQMPSHGGAHGGLHNGPPRGGHPWLR